MTGRSGIRLRRGLASRPFPRSVYNVAEMDASTTVKRDSGREQKSQTGLTRSEELSGSYGCRGGPISGVFTGFAMP
jgi:hypothetical protein